MSFTRPFSRFFSGFAKSNKPLQKMSIATVPATQRAAVVHQYGGPSAIEYSETYPSPKVEDVRANEVLVKNVYSGVNYIGA